MASERLPAHCPPFAARCRSLCLDLAAAGAEQNRFGSWRAPQPPKGASLAPRRASYEAPLELPGGCVAAAGAAGARACNNSSSRRVPAPSSLPLLARSTCSLPTLHPPAAGSRRRRRRCCGSRSEHTEQKLIRLGASPVLVANKASRVRPLARNLGVKQPAQSCKVSADKEAPALQAARCASAASMRGTRQQLQSAVSYCSV